MKTALNPNRPFRALAWGLLALAATLFANPARAQQPPDGMAYQGFLTDANGLPLGGTNTGPQNYNVQFRVWSASTAGTEVWAEQQTVTVDGGNFSAILGQGTAINNQTEGAFHTIPMGGMFFGPNASSLYMELTVLGVGPSGVNSGNVTISPRLKLLAAPYAFLAQNAYTAQGLGTSNNLPLLSVAGNTITLGANATFSGYFNVGGSVNATQLNLNGNGLASGNTTEVDLYSPNTFYFRKSDGTEYAHLNAGGLTIASGGLSVPSGTTINGVLNVTGVGTFSSQVVVQSGGVIVTGHSIMNSLEVNTGDLTVDGGNINLTYPGGLNAYGLGYNRGLTGSGGVFATINASLNNGKAGEMDFYAPGQFNFNTSGPNDDAVGLTTYATIDTRGLTMFGSSGLSLPGAARLNGGATIGSGQTVYLNGGTTAWMSSQGSGTGEYLELSARGGGGFYFTPSANAFHRVRIDGNGRIGVSTDNPSFPVDVETTVSYTIASGNGHYGGSGFGDVSGSTVDLSIYANGGIGTGTGFYAISDRRVKDVVGCGDSSRDLADIEKLRVTDYRMIDQIANGNRVKRGFLAQDVEKVIPGAVTTSTNFVPDIYKLAESNSYDATGKALTVKLADAHSLKVGDQVRLYADDKKLEVEVKSVGSDREFTVSGCEQAPKVIFVYGKQVPDFHALNYDHIFTTGIGAIQELAKQVGELRDNEATRLAQLDKKDAQIAKLEREVAEMRATVTGMAQTVREIRSATMHDSHASFTPAAADGAKAIVAANVNR